MNNKLKEQINFIFEIDKIKSIIRKTKLFHTDEYENDAEHSWHITLMAIVLKEYANEQIGILKVIKMLLIHDLVEIDTGDIIVYKKNKQNVKEEEKAAERIFGILPENQKTEFINLWKEFEKRETIEAKFAAAIDRLEPVMQNIYKNCETWNEHNISYDSVIGINKKIGDGSKELWNYIKKELDRCLEEGLFNSEE